MNIEEQEVHQTIHKASNMMLCCEDASNPACSTYVFMGDGMLLNGTRIHTVASQRVSAEDSNADALASKDVIYKMRFIQAAACKHEPIHRQLNVLLMQLKREVLQVQKKTDSEHSALLRMLYQSFGCELHGLVALRT